MRVSDNHDEISSRTLTAQPDPAPMQQCRKRITAADRDACNGITSASPEFSKGVYHYVMLDVSNASSSIRCFTGKVDSSLTTTMPGMGGFPPNG
jgi:hypothetical protein